MRLGNLIDAWFFGSLGSLIKSHQLARLAPEQQAGSLGAWLASHGNVSLVDATRRAALVDASRPVDCANSRRDSRQDLVRRACAVPAQHIALPAGAKKRGAADAQRFQYPLYHYNSVALALPEIQRDLAAQLDAWAAQASLLPMPYWGPRHAVVHYRLGDFIHLGQLIHPRSVAAAAAALDPNVVEVLEGGVSHEATADDVRTSESLRRLLLSELRRALPRARVLSAPPRPADVDFLRLARAPMLVTAGGSYAIAAAVASSSEYVRTPAAIDTNFPQRGAEPVRVVRPGWVTYAYDSWTDPKLLRTSDSSRS